MALHQMTKWMIQILSSFQNPRTTWKLMITRRSKDPSVFEPVLVEAKRCAWTYALLYWKNQSLFVAPSDCEWSRNGRLNQDLLGTYSPLIKHEGLLVDLCSPLHIALYSGVNTPDNSEHGAGGDQLMIDDIVKSNFRRLLYLEVDGTWKITVIQI